MKVFILAGGFATRLWPITEKRAKPLLPLAGKPLLTHLIDGLPTDLQVHVSTNAIFEEGFRTWLQHLGRKDVHLTIEDTRHDGEKLGALGAVAAWIRANKIEDDVLLLTGDNYFGLPLSRILDAYDGKTTLLAAHDLQDRAKAKHFGTVLADASGLVTGFEEKPAEPKSSLVSTGCSILPKSLLLELLLFADKKPDNVGGIFEHFLARRLPMQVLQFSEPWLDIGSFNSYLEAHALIVGEKIVTGDGSTVESTNCTGSIAIGKNCTIKNSELRDCIVFDGAHIENTTLTRCIVDNDCVLQGVDLQEKMLRAGTRLELQ